MRKVSVISLKPGQKIARAIRNSEGQILLSADSVLTDKYIKQLAKWGIPSVYIDDGLLPDLEIDDLLSDQTRYSAIKQVKNFFSASQNKRTFRENFIPKISSTVDNIIDEVLSNKSLMINLTDIRSYDEYTFGHSVNVCALSVMTGITLGYSREKLGYLGLAAMLHDVGKVDIPVEIINKPGKLTEEEYEEVKKHTTSGYDILKQHSNLSNYCAIVAFQHHERYDGEGYPRGLKGNEINVYARITGLIDVYDAMTADRIYRKAHPIHEVYEMIAGAGNSLFDYKIVQAFLKNVAAYPVGTLVKLSNGLIGIVIETKKGYSMYPRVKILFSEKGQPVKGDEEICLADQRDIVIKEVLDDQSATFINLKK